MRALTTSAALLALVAVTNPAQAVFLTVEHENLPECDDLLVPTLVDELGLPGIFPDDEIIDAAATFTDQIACPGSYEPNGIPNTQVLITNLTNTPFNNLWYVADPETRITNVDGLVNGGQAFKIDDVGFNKPLISESGLADGVFSPGETWAFIIDNYSNTFGLPASAFGSPGAVGLGSGFDQFSSGSIIATPIPEPAALLVAAFGLTVAACRRRVVG